MKNRHTAIMVFITCMFVSFALGFLSGRSTAPGDTIVSQVSAQTRENASSSDAGAAEESPVILPIVTEEAETNPATSLPPAAEVPTTVPAVEETVSPATTATEPPAAGNSSLINVNTASAAQLDTLPGIGPVLAQRIIDYREAHGPFTSVSQLILVEGIGEKRLAAIIDLITTE